MKNSLHILITGLLLAGAMSAHSENKPAPAQDGSQHCISCHDFGPESPVHALKEGPHTTAWQDGEQIGRGDCESCHGPSGNHANAPLQVPPNLSYGPRWSATAAAQDDSCLACHEENVADHWQDSVHMLNNVTCISCHDIHTGGDKILFSSKKGEVCTVCHKAQKSGMHGLEETAGNDPGCSTCHNPHNHESVEARLLHTRSGGCRACHDLVQMAQDNTVTDKAKNYHKVMVSPERTCVECHGGITHDPVDSVTTFAPTPSRSKEITLFYPGQSDSEYMIERHPGAQPLRQGAGCQQCHRGEETRLGESLAGDIKPAFRKIAVTFDRSPDNLHMKLRWRGTSEDTLLSIMWGGDGNEAFRRGGCFAACHSDMAGMSRDRGQQTDKYLWTSREQQQQIGRPPITKNQAELQQMIAEGRFVVLWQIELSSGVVSTATLLNKLDWQEESAFGATVEYENGWWQIDLRRSLKHQSKHLVKLKPTEKYTLGIALNGANNQGAAHWVSLPMTLSESRDDSDFVID